MMSSTNPRVSQSGEMTSASLAHLTPSRQWSAEPPPSASTNIGRSISSGAGGYKSPPKEKQMSDLLIREVSDEVREALSEKASAEGCAELQSRAIQCVPDGRQLCRA